MIDPASLSSTLTPLLPEIRRHRRHNNATPFILGLSGLQGSGKSTWAAAICEALTTEHNFLAQTVSIDDFYYDYPDLLRVAKSNPQNKLLQHRGQPGTHDESLLKRFFDQIFEGNDPLIEIPAFDKSLHGGKGGRAPVDQWVKIPRQQLDVVVFEGWCLGFQALDQRTLESRWHQACTSGDRGAKANAVLNEDTPKINSLVNTLSDHSLDDITTINNNLARYCQEFMGPWRFDSFVHLSTDRLVNVYKWRLDQEQALRRRGSAMSDEEVVHFIRGYMPAYELYLEQLQTQCFFGGENNEGKAHLQLCLAADRRVLSIKRL